MATFTTSPGDIIVPTRGVPIRYFPEAASQTFKRGAVLIMGTTGVENECAEASDNPTAAILGIAAEDASGVHGTKIGVYFASANAYFRAKAVAADALDFSDLGQARAVQKHALYTTTYPGVWVIDTTDASNDSVVLVRVHQPDAAEGDFECWYEFRFVTTATLAGVNA